jgi:hypothetical protein
LEDRVHVLKIKKEGLQRDIKKTREYLMHRYGSQSLESLSAQLDVEIEDSRTKLQAIENQIGTLKARAQNLVEVRAVFSDYSGADDRFQELTQSVMRSHELFKKKEKELPLCGDPVDCREDLAALKSQHSEIVQSGQLAVSWREEYLARQEQRIQSVRWVSSADRQSADAAWIRLRRKMATKRSQALNEILNFHSNWDPARYNVLVRPG